MPFSAFRQSFHSSLLRPNVPQAHWRTTIFHMVWMGWRSWKEISLCVDFSHSIFAKKKLEQQIHTQYDQSVLAFRLHRGGLTAWVRFPSATLAWNYPPRRVPEFCGCHCLPLNKVYTPQKTKSGRACARSPPNPPPFGWQLAVPGYGNSEWLNEMA